MRVSQSLPDLVSLPECPFSFVDSAWLLRGVEEFLGVGTEAFLVGCTERFRNVRLAAATFIGWSVKAMVMGR